jgi:hypothetical protein
MANFSDGLVLSYPTTSDLSGSAYCAVELTSAGKVALLADGDSIALGILTDNVADGSTTEAMVSVQLTGVAKMKAGATITLGTNLAVMATTGGEATTATTGKYAIGIPLATTVDNDVFEVLIDRFMVN